MNPSHHLARQVQGGSPHGAEQQVIWEPTKVTDLRTAPQELPVLERPMQTAGTARAPRSTRTLTHKGRKDGERAATQVPIPALPPASCVTLVKGLHISEPQFPHLQNGDSPSPVTRALAGLHRGVNTTTWVETPGTAPGTSFPFCLTEKAIRSWILKDE